MKTVYVVVGYRNTGSGSLTYPEDFDFISAHSSEKSAEDIAKKMNKDSFGSEDPDGDTDDEEFEEPDSDAMIYEVQELSLEE